MSWWDERDTWGEDLRDFPKVVASIREVVGEHAVLTVAADPDSSLKSHVEVYGILEEPPNQPRDGALFTVGQSGYLRLDSSEVTGGHRSSIDGLWSIRIDLRETSIVVSDDRDR